MTEVELSPAQRDLQFYNSISQLENLFVEYDNLSAGISSKGSVSSSPGLKILNRGKIPQHNIDLSERL